MLKKLTYTKTTRITVLYANYDYIIIFNGPEFDIIIIIHHYLVWIHWRGGDMELYDKEVLLFDYTFGCKFDVGERSCTVLVSAAGLGSTVNIEEA